jgi:hypothetical protein
MALKAIYIIFDMLFFHRLGLVYWLIDAESRKMKLSLGNGFLAQRVA